MNFDTFITKFDKPRRTTAGFLVRCPSHEDSTASLQVCRANDGKILLHCFAGCTTEAVVSKLGLKMQDLFPDTPAKPFSIPSNNGHKSATLTERPTIDKIYSYQNAVGEEVYQVVRLKPKSFRQRRKNEKGDWLWTMDGVVRVLYRLPEVQKSETVIVVEGEKDADNLVELGFVATCNVGGAGKWLDGYTETLKGKNVVLCGDNDEAGKKHIELVFDSIAGQAKNVKIIHLPKTIKDVSDYIATFPTKEEAKRSISELIGMAYPHIHGIKLPVYSVSELEEPYKRHCLNLEGNSFSLGKWLPSLGRLRPLVMGELAFILGNVGTGKTGILQNIALAAQPMPCLMFELELPPELLFERFVSNLSKFTCREVEAAFSKAPEESMKSVLEYKAKNLFVCTESRLNLEDIENYITRSELKIGERPKVVLIDYIQLMQAQGINRREKVSDLAEGLKTIAKKTRTIIFAASQIKRPDDESPEVGLHDGKESGSIEASCGLLIGAWRDLEDASLLHFKILKSTKGGAGMQIKCNFNGERMQITERTTIKNEDLISHSSD